MGIIFTWLIVLPGLTVSALRHPSTANASTSAPSPDATVPSNANSLTRAASTESILPSQILGED